MDHKRRYFIAMAGLLAGGTPYSRCSWQQVNYQPNLPQKVTLLIQQPQSAKSYYSTCAVSIDRQNRFCHNNLQLKRMEKDRLYWVHLSILAMILVVKSYLAIYAWKKQGTGECSQKDFCSCLAKELISVKTAQRWNIAMQRLWQQQETVFLCAKTWNNALSTIFLASMLMLMTSRHNNATCRSFCLSFVLTYSYWPSWWTLFSISGGHVFKYAS